MCFRWTSPRHGQAWSMLVKLSHTLNQNEMVLNKEKVLYKQCSVIFLEDTLHQYPMVTLQYIWDKPGYPCALWYFHSTYLTAVILKLLKCSRVFAELQHIPRNNCISVASEVTTATYNDFILVFPPAPK